MLRLSCVPSGPLRTAGTRLGSRGHATARRRGTWDTAEHRRGFLQRMAVALNLQSPNDWSKVTERDVVRLGGRRLLAQYGNSLPAALADLLPDAVARKETKERRTTPQQHGTTSRSGQGGGSREKQEAGHWEVAENRLRFMERVAAAKGVKEAKDWKAVTAADVVAEGGATLLKRYQTSMARLLADTYGYEEGECRAKMPQGHWDSMENQRRFMDRVAEAYNVQEAGDWSRVRYKDVASMGGRGLVARHGSVFATLQAVYPDQEFPAHVSRARVPPGHWDVAENRRKFMQEVEEELGIEEAAGWRDVTGSQVVALGGAGVMQRHGNSIYRTLVELFPERAYKLHECRRKVPQGHWQEVANRRAFLEHVAKVHGIKTPEEWAGVTVDQVIELGGAELMRRCGGLVEALREAFPEQRGAWDAVTCRPSVPMEHWRSVENVRAFLEVVRARCGLREPEDWQRVSVQQIRSLRGGGLLRQYTLVEALRLAYPEETWDEEEFTRKARKATQQQLLHLARSLLPDCTVQEEVRHPALSSESGSREKYSLELDVFVPEHNLAIEYNGEQHYNELPFFGPLEMYQRRDEEKRRLCAAAGIRLLTVPYWWDRSAASLAASLRLAVPGITFAPDVEEGLRATPSSPIPAANPKAAAPERKAGVASVRAAGVWDETQDPTGVLVAPRPGGVQVRWLGGEAELSSRFGVKLHPPAAWVASMPAEGDFLGELVQEGSSLGRVVYSLFLSPKTSRGAKDEDWAGVTFQAVDVLDTMAPAKERMRALNGMEDSASFKRVAAVECEGRQHLRELLDANGGSDGLLLRQPDSKLVLNRPLGARLRTVHEAEVEMVAPSSGSRSLRVAVDNGAVQAVHCDSAAWEDPPSAGTKLRIGHFGRWPSTGRYRMPFLVAEQHG